MNFKYGLLQRFSNHDTISLGLGIPSGEGLKQAEDYFSGLKW
jgi:hypothetical protein